MGQDNDFKIKVLPRPNEKNPGPKPEAKNSASPTGTEAKLPRMIIYVGTVCVLAATALWVAPRLKPKAQRQVAKVENQTQLASNGPAGVDPAEESAKRHEQDLIIQRQLLVHTRELENMQFKDALNEPNGTTPGELPETRSYGVQIDSDDSSERLYEELHGDPVHDSDTLPGDKINARLANRKWLNEQEREEKITFIRNFIRSAYDRGYEVDIDQNLVVVGVRKVNTTKKLNINQVIDRITASQNL